MMIDRIERFRTLPIAILLMTMIVLANPSQGSAQQPGNGTTFGMAIHGGGGVRPVGEMTPEVEAAYRAALSEALASGYAILNAGGTSVDAVEAAIRVMEDSPLFNAGKGASYNRDGYHELDASIMDGRSLEAGGVAVVQRVKNPISLARRVMERSPHVLIAGQGALEFARSEGLEIVAPHYFFTERKWESLQQRLREGTPYGTGAEDSLVIAEPRPGAAEDAGLYGTVGAVALDRNGNLAAGTSTGGREGKLPGRVGDSPIIGAGNYANNRTLAVSSTGLGEYVLRRVSTKDMSDLMEYRGYTLKQATQSGADAIMEMGGGIGVVAIDAQGNIAMPYSGDGMYRGYVRDDGEIVVHIYRD